MSAEPKGLTASELSDHAYRALVEAAPDIVIVFDQDSRIRYVNPAVTSLLGFSTAELVGSLLLDYFHPDDRPKARERVRSILDESSATTRRNLYRLRCKDGDYRHLETVAVNRINDHDIDGIFAIARDVTQYAQQESSRLAAEERRRLAAEIARFGIWEWNLDTGALEADLAVRQLARQHTGQTWAGPGEFLARFAEEDRAALQQAMGLAMSGRGTCQQVARMPMPDGTLRWLYIYARRQTTAEGLSPWVVGSVMDVTEQKRVEEEALRRGELLELASRGAGIGTWTWYPQQDRAEMDDISLELHGLPPAPNELPTAICNSTMHPDEMEELNRLESELASGARERFDFVYRVRRPDGGWRWLMDRSRITGRAADGTVTRVSGITLDIDADKQRETELAEQRLRLALALKAARQGLWDLDVEKAGQYVDERYAEITGLAPDILLHAPSAFDALIHEQDRPRLVVAMRGCLEGERDELGFEGRLLTPEGRLKWVAVEGAVVSRRPDGTAARIIGTLSDLTDRRRLDQLVQAGELVAATGSFEFDAQLEQIFWSRGTYRVFDYPEDFVPRFGAIADLLQPGSRSRFLSALQALRDEGRGFDIEVESRTARGRRIWVRLIGRADAFGGKPVRFNGIVQDITARKQLESALVDAANREQQRLGRELHDGVGQELTGIALHLQGLSGKAAESNSGLEQALDHVSGLLSATIRNTRMLAHGLAPVSRGRGGLEGALQRLASHSTSVYGIPVGISFDLRRPVELDEIAGGDLYRICQEALSNAVRHSHPSKVEVRLCSTLEFLTLEIVDDGHGLPPAGERGEGMGLQSMAYRAENLHGTLEVTRNPAGGTRVTVRIPLAH